MSCSVQESSPFQDVLVSLLLGRGFAFGRLADSTVEDWLWYRLHLVHLLGQDNDQSPEFKNQLEKLRQQVVSLGPSHFAEPLSSVKALLLTAQFTRGLQQLQLQEHTLRSVALHMALVLQRFGTLEALEEPLDVSAFLPHGD